MPVFGVPAAVAAHMFPIFQADTSSQQPEQHKQQRPPSTQAPTAAAAAAGQEVSVEVIPRSREVGQSYVTSVFTTLYSLLWAFWMVTRHRPQLVSLHFWTGAIVLLAVFAGGRIDLT